MARYRLTSPHYINRLTGPAYLEAGDEIDSAEMPPTFSPTPHMTPLDYDAEVTHAEVVRQAIVSGRSPAIVGYGHVRDMHRGGEHLEATGFGDTR